MKKKIIIIICIFVAIISVSFIPDKGNNPVFETRDTHWADSVFKSLTPDERIAQLFMVAAYSDEKKQNPEDIEKLISEYKIGGLIFFQGGPVRQAILTNYFQAHSKIPLLISIDGEWGLAMRLDSTVQFPRQMMLGSIQNDSLIYEMGKEIARECKRIGIHVNLAPVADVNNNPLNPVISNRSFGEDKKNVARKAMMYMKGMQDNGILANAKHFPGHGNTDSDSHKTLPTITSSKARMDELELYPFKELIKQGLGSVMVAHLFIPAYDTTSNTASTLSKKIVTDLLKNDLQFKGLVFTDALNMKGVSKYFKPGEVDVKALLAGNDVLLFSEDVPTAISEIKKAIERGDITQKEIDKRCKKILVAKQWAGLNHYAPVELKNIYDDLNTKQAEFINRKLIESSLTLLQNKNNLIPLKNLDTLRIATLSLGYEQKNVFQDRVGMYAPAKHFGLDKDAKQKECDSVLKWLKEFNLIIIQINNTNNNPKNNFGITDRQNFVLKQVMKNSKTIVEVFANPYALSKIDSIEFADAVVIGYEDNDLIEDLSAQLIFGGISAQGKLPVTASPAYKLGTGIETAAPIRFKYTIPEEFGYDSKKFEKVDSIAMNGIEEGAFPGCQVFVAKEGKVIYYKSYGWHTYEKKRTVKNTDLYDLASITKIAASTASLMTLVEQKKIHLDDYLCYYLPELEGTNKQNITFCETFTHQAGMRDWIPFFLRTMEKGEYLPGYYDKKHSSEFPTRVAKNLYLHKNYSDTIYKEILESKITDAGKYKYSDLGYYLLKKIIEKETKMTLEEYTRNFFYAPLGLPTLTYKPREKFDLKQIIPTEYDVKFRKQLIHGDVHDQGAAMLGGVGGHAGLFSDANDLAVMMQMFLQKGEYGGKRFIDTATVGEFTRCQYCTSNRRAIGFDKPETDSKKDSPVCESASHLSFGHQGFTGTLAWADPQNKLVYVFLSNRIYPDADNKKLTKMGVRSKIQSVIYEIVK